MSLKGSRNIKMFYFIIEEKLVS